MWSIRGSYERHVYYFIIIIYTTGVFNVRSQTHIACGSWYMFGQYQYITPFKINQAFSKNMGDLSTSLYNKLI